jgi:LysR family transcriptional regulator, flagellar master operon regulator
MDLALIKTFIEVAEAGSFVSAADKLFVTQSAVSLRVQRLESQLGRPLFIRSSTGAELTPAGKEFEGFAQVLLRNWRQACQQVAIPEGYSRSLTIGAQVSLWPRLGFRWIDGLRQAMPDLSLKAELGMPDTLTRSMTEGVMQISLTYRPSLRPGLSVEKLLEDELVLVAPFETNRIEEIKGRYAFVDWGPEFLQFHDSHLARFTNPGLTLDIGSLAARFVLESNCAAYLPARFVKRYTDNGRMHMVPDAPSFHYPAWSVWRDDLDEDLALVANETLVSVIAKAESDTQDVIDLI